MQTWDGTSAIDGKTITAVADAFVATAPYAELSGVLFDLANSAYAPPDPKGDAALKLNGIYDPALDLLLPVQEDTFQPLWAGPPPVTWQNVPLDGTARLDLTLVDEDLSNDDNIGTVELNTDDFIAALKEQDDYHVKTAKNVMTDTILFVTISVSAAAVQ